jgi:hypothetical protein
MENRPETGLRNIKVKDNFIPPPQPHQLNNSSTLHQSPKQRPINQHIRPHKHNKAIITANKMSDTMKPQPE